MVSNVCYEGSEIFISLISYACTHNSKTNQYAPPPFSSPFAYISRFACVHSYQSSLPRFFSQASSFVSQWKIPSFIEISVFSVKMSRYHYFQWKCRVIIIFSENVNSSVINVVHRACRLYKVKHRCVDVSTTRTHRREGTLHGDECMHWCTANGTAQTHNLKYMSV